MVHFQPDCAATDIIESLSQALHLATAQDRVILSGDFNCPIDKSTRKTNEVISFLQEEGMILVNSSEMPTHISHNGGSAIDLIFVRSFCVKGQRQLWNTEEAIIRKHLPIETRLEIEDIARTSKTTPTLRKVDVSVIEENMQQRSRIKELIEESNLDEAMDTLGELMQNAAIQPRRRKGKSWFDKECYEKRRSRKSQKGKNITM